MKNLITLLSFFLLVFFSHSPLASAECSSSEAEIVACATGQLTLNITFDNAPMEFNWELKNANNTVFASGYTGYPQSNAGMTVTEIMPAISDGDYALVIFDGNGNGLCCTNGNGDYELLDGNNTVIASGAVYTYSEITTFCYNSTNNDVFDLQAPTDVVLSYSNLSSTSVDLDWTTATDNVAVFAYGVFLNGAYGDMTFSTNYHIWFLQPGVTYSFFIISRDDIGNFSNPSNVVTFTTPTSNPVTIAQQISASYFESGWDNWIDGGKDCHRYSGSRSSEGSYSIRIRDNSGTKSSMTSAGMDLSAFDSIKVEFDYFHHGYENSEDFFLKLYENGAYTTVNTYTRGTEFTSNGLYSSSVTLKATDYNFASNNRIRLQSDASNNNDKIYVDAVVITGYYQGTSSSSRSMKSRKDIHSFLMHGLTPEISLREETKIDSEISVYPNPAQDILQIKGLSHDMIHKASIYNSAGVLAATCKVEDQTIDIAQLSSGFYYLVFHDEKSIKKPISFIKK